MRIFFALIIMVCLTACERQITDADLQRISPGMNMKEVESILGKPTDSEQFLEKHLYKCTTLYTYEQKDKRIQLTFINGHLVANPIDITILDK